MNLEFETCPIAPKLTFRGIRRRILEEVWRQSDEAHRQGITYTYQNLGRIIKEQTEAEMDRIQQLRDEYDTCLWRAAEAAANDTKVTTLDETETQIKEILNADSEP